MQIAIGLYPEFTALDFVGPYHEYRREIGQLRGDIDDGLQFGNDVRAAVLQEQLDQVSRQLAAAFGLGGQSREPPRRRSEPV
jgi:hypothetical protein